MRMTLDIAFGIIYVWVMCRLWKWAEHKFTYEKLYKFMDTNKYMSRFLDWRVHRYNVKRAAEFMKENKGIPLSIMTQDEAYDLMHQATMWAMTIKQVTDRYMDEQDIDAEFKRLSNG